MKKIEEDALYAAANALRLVAYSGDFHCFDDHAWNAVNTALDKADQAIKENAVPGIDEDGVGIAGDG